MTTDDEPGGGKRDAETARTVRPGLLALLASILVAVVAACSSTRLPTDGSTDLVAETPPDLVADTPPDVPVESHTDAQREAPPPEAPPDVGIDHPDVDAGPCTEPLADVAANCPPSYDAIASFACGHCPGCSLSAGSCGEFLIFFGRFGFDTSLCYYDATSRALVALVHSTDYNAYCGGSAYVYSAGVPVGACERPFFNPGLPPYVCANGGPFDGDVPDL
jgi:hypothetical protein